MKSLSILVTLLLVILFFNSCTPLEVAQTAYLLKPTSQRIKKADEKIILSKTDTAQTVIKKLGEPNNTIKMNKGLIFEYRKSYLYELLAFLYDTRKKQMVYKDRMSCVGEYWFAYTDAKENEEKLKNFLINNFPCFQETVTTAPVPPTPTTPVFKE